MASVTRTLRALPRRASPLFTAATTATTTTTTTAHAFSTSAAPRTRNDTSTIDFAYLPMDLLRQAPPPPPLRVPLLHSTTNPRRSGPNAVEPESGILLASTTANVGPSAAVLSPASVVDASAGPDAALDRHADADALPAIHTVAGDGTHFGAPAAMSDADHRSDEVDYAALEAGMGRAVDAVEQAAKSEGGIVRELWEGVLEDILGPKKAKK